MYGIERAEIKQLKQINLKEYLLSFDKDNYRQRNNGTIVKKDKSHSLMKPSYHCDNLKISGRNSPAEIISVWACRAHTVTIFTFQFYFKKRFEIY